MKIIVSLLLFASFLSAAAQTKTTRTIIYSEKVKDSFDLYISVPDNMDTHSSYDIVYYCDANLKSGRKLREMISSGQYDVKVRKTIFVGVGHRGNFHELRRRDFILPSVNHGDTSGRSAGYGQTDHFYQFLKTELIPRINKEFKTNKDNNSIFGHSLGGLFAFYCLFKNESVFKNYFALSPALWVDHYSIYKFNKLGRGSNTDKYLYFSAGGMEVMNHIKKGTDRMQKFLEEKKYPLLQFEYKVHPGKTHLTQIKYSIDHMLSR